MSDLTQIGQREREAFGLMHQLHFGQKRKLSGLPFSVHPTHVHDLMCKWNVSKETRIAAILHDSFEDTPLTEEDLMRRFKSAVTKTVLGVSEGKKTAMTLFDKTSSWYERKVKKLKSIVNEPHETVLLFFGDKVANVIETNTYIRDRPHFEDSFNCSPEEMAWYFRESAKIAKGRFLNSVIDPYPWNFGEKDIRGFEDVLDRFEVKLEVSSFHTSPNQKNIFDLGLPKTKTPASTE